MVLKNIPTQTIPKTNNNLKELRQIAEALLFIIFSFFSYTYDIAVFRQARAKGENMKSVNKKRGLTDFEAEQSQKQYGANILSERKSKSFLRCFFENLGDPIIRILLAALAVNLFLVFRGGDLI